MIHIIDDEKSIRDLLKRVVDMVGLSAQTFNSVTEYFEHMKSISYQLPKAVITDINMAGMIGCHIVEVIKQLDPQIIVTVMSGNLLQCHPACCALHRAEGLIDYKLEKPLRMENLLEILESLKQ